MGVVCIILLLLSVPAFAELHVLTLGEAVELALRQNPDLTLARLEEQRAVLEARAAKDPFSTRFVVGSGLAYSSGFPLSIEGAAPSLVRAEAARSLFNKPQSYKLAQAREEARGAGLDTQSKRNDIVHKTAMLFLDAEQARRAAEIGLKQVDALERVREVVELRVKEGRELPIAARRASLDAARARQRAEAMSDEAEFAERALAVVLGYAPEDQVRAAAQERRLPDIPVSDEAAVSSAIESHPQIRRLQSSLVAKGFEARSAKSARLPVIDLVAQYAMLTRFNNYDRFFQTFQRNNFQIGASIQLPLLPGSGAEARAAQVEVESTRIRNELNATRNRISLDTRRAYQRIRQAESAREVARLDLDVAREELSLFLAQLEEGRATLQQVEQARFQENERWMEYYRSRQELERARLDLLRETGDLAAALR